MLYSLHWKTHAVFPVNIITVIQLYLLYVDVKLSSGAAESTDIEPTIGERMRTTAVIRLVVS